VTSGVSGSHGLIASCTQARVFAVNTISGNTLTLDAALGATPFAAATAEVFPLQTIAYYVKASSNGRTTSLYRRIFDGDQAVGLEQELIEGVEMLQVRYGLDTTTPNSDGVIDGNYVNANAVANWSQVVAIRMTLLLRASAELDQGLSSATSGPVDTLTVTYPTTTRSVDRRVFSTTVAVRNRISYF
jgi:type IV pilus assembly protein PilW